MADKNQTQHETLINAGWRYDASSDRYSAPGSATDGSQRMFNLAAAWLAFETGTAPMPPISADAQSTPPTGVRKVDPRKMEPQ